MFLLQLSLIVPLLEYISTLEMDIAERDRLLQAIRSELGSTQSENLALRQEVAALKRALLEGRQTGAAQTAAADGGDGGAGTRGRGGASGNCGRVVDGEPGGSVTRITEHCIEHYRCPGQQGFGPKGTGAEHVQIIT